MACPRSPQLERHLLAAADVLRGSDFADSAGKKGGESDLPRGIDRLTERDEDLTV